jgi:lysylphosphatidylglycerol synthetase-like protein (DUF2156 family)
VAFGLSVVAIVYSVALLAAITAIPADDGQTLLEYGGPWSLAIFAQPLLVSVLMWHLLRRRCHNGSRHATRAAWVIATIYLIYSVLGGFSIAAGGLPAALLLFLALATTPPGSPNDT